MNFTRIILAYFLIGAFMWGGGALTWENAGLVTAFVDSGDQGDIEVNESTSGQLEQIGGPVQEASESVSGGGLIAIWNIIDRILGYLFWPITALQVNGAPPVIVVVVGGPFVVVFFGAVINLIAGAI